ncbi:MAG: class I SAM-dependent methyltransferase [Gammaproteobacteria bacterium]|nr:class I SAM-dependent methyltransferase [Gammaproteobacteria bacterium]
MQAPSLSISCTDASLQAIAQSLAIKLALPYTELDPQQIQLVVDNEHIEIRAPDLGNPVFIDFEAGKNAHRRQFGGGRGQPLAKAIGLKQGATPTVIDATAGFGRDAFVLAHLGCELTLVERNPLIATLLSDALIRAVNNSEIAPIISRMKLVNQDSVSYLQQLATIDYPDVIYMDPMYPGRDKTALVKKEMQLLHQLAGPDTDSEQLLTSALTTAKKRVVVKRPKSAPFVGDQTPSTKIESKNTRYDVYITF